MNELQSATGTPSPSEIASIMQEVVIGGDLSRLSPDARMKYYARVTESLGLNPLTKPFEFIPLPTEGGRTKLTLYATKAATDQLRAKYSISVTDVRIDVSDTEIAATVFVRDPSGRTDADVGVVPTSFYHFKRRETITLSGADLANARMKAVTKAKRRATLSFCGLGMLDETEVADIVASSGPRAEEADRVASEIAPTTTLSVTTSAPTPDPATATAEKSRWDRWVDAFAIRHGTASETAEKVLWQWMVRGGYAPEDLDHPDRSQEIFAAAKDEDLGLWGAMIEDVDSRRAAASTD